MNTEAMMFMLLRKSCCYEDEPIDIELHQETLEEIYRLSKRHDLAHIIGHYLGQTGVLKNADVGQRFKQQAAQAVFRYANLKLTYTQICSFLESAEIPFLPLKGAVMRRYYPEPWMRTSCDIDILVKEEDLERAVKKLESTGYRNEGRSMYDVSLYSPRGVHIELHFNLIADYVSAKQGEILSHIWERVIPVKGFSYQYEMPDDLFYFYHIAHMAKHFKEGGCGVKPFLDLWLLNKQKEFDETEKYKLLKKGGLLAFAKAVEQLSNAWFENAEKDALAYDIEAFVLRNGVYGSYEAKITMNKINKNHWQYIWFRVFLPYEYMKDHYPILKKQKWLLPACEVWRWIKLIFNGGIKRSEREMKTRTKATKEQQTNLTGLLEALEL